MLGPLIYSSTSDMRRQTTIWTQAASPRKLMPFRRTLPRPLRKPISALSLTLHYRSGREKMPANQRFLASVPIRYMPAHDATPVQLNLNRQFKYEVLGGGPSNALLSEIVRPGLRINWMAQEQQRYMLRHCVAPD